MTTIQTLLLAVNLAGGPTAVQPVVQVPLKGVQAGMARATIFRQVGSGNLGFSVALMPDGYLGLRVREGGQARVYSIPELRSGVLADLPSGSYRMAIDDRTTISIAQVGGRGAVAQVDLLNLVEALYRLGVHVNFSPVAYTVLYEDGSDVAEAGGLLRRDSNGMFWITHKTASELTTIRYFVAINGTLYGMRLEKPWLVFYSKPSEASLMSNREKPVFPLN